MRPHFLSAFPTRTSPLCAQGLSTLSTTVHQPKNRAWHLGSMKCFTSETYSENHITLKDVLSHGITVGHIFQKFMFNLRLQTFKLLTTHLWNTPKKVEKK